MTQETIRKVIYEDIENLHADDNPEIVHYIVDYKNGNYEYYINIDIQFYLYDSLDDEIYKVYKEYTRNGFFIYAMDMDLFISTYSYIFNDTLIDDLYKIIYEMDKMQRL